MKKLHFLLLLAFFLAGAEVVLFSQKIALKMHRLSELLEESSHLQRELLSAFAGLASFPRQVRKGRDHMHSMSSSIQQMQENLEVMKTLTQKIDTEVVSITASTRKIRQATGHFREKLTAFAQATESFAKEGKATRSALQDLRRMTEEMVSSLATVSQMVKKKGIQKLLKRLKR